MLWIKVLIKEVVQKKVTSKPIFILQGTKKEEPKQILEMLIIGFKHFPVLSRRIRLVANQ